MFLIRLYSEVYYIILWTNKTCSRLKNIFFSFYFFNFWTFWSSKNIRSPDRKTSYDGWEPLLLDDKLWDKSAVVVVVVDLKKKRLVLRHVTSSMNFVHLIWHEALRMYFLLKNLKRCKRKKTEWKFFFSWKKILKPKNILLFSTKNLCAFFEYKKELCCVKGRFQIGKNVLTKLL